MIRYMPKLDSVLWTRKTQKLFEDIEDLRLFIADQKNRTANILGLQSRFYNPCDVEVNRTADFDPILALTNCCDVLVDGHVVGYCGE